MQVPALTIVRVEPEIVQTLEVLEVKTTANPDVAEAERSKLPAETSLSASEPNVMTLVPWPTVKVMVVVVEE